MTTEHKPHNRPFSELLKEQFREETEKLNAMSEPKQQRRPKIKEPKEVAELRDAFHEWTENHGLVWFDSDARLAEAIAGVLNIDLVWGEGTERKCGR